MLDKSIPFYRIIMRRKAGTPIPEIDLPTGFLLSGYSPGDEHTWAEIVASVGEFDFDINQALKRFESDYMPYVHELEHRLLFIQTDEGRKIATYTNWWMNIRGEKIPAVHFVAVKPEFQGLGLGKAIIFKGLQRCLSIDGDKDIVLRTQTWSYKAIGIYLKAGFRFMEESSLDKYENDFAKAKHLLEEKMIIKKI